MERRSCERKEDVEISQIAVFQRQWIGSENKILGREWLIRLRIEVVAVDGQQVNLLQVPLLGVDGGKSRIQCAGDDVGNFTEGIGLFLSEGLLLDALFQFRGWQHNQGSAEQDGILKADKDGNLGLQIAFDRHPGQCQTLPWFGKILGLGDSS
jgi:hypothetical protein